MTIGRERGDVEPSGFASASADAERVIADSPDERKSDPALVALARILARAAGAAAFRQGLHFDLDDPRVARDLMSARFDAVLGSRPAATTAGRPRRRGHRKVDVAAQGDVNAEILHYDGPLDGKVPD